VNLSRGFWSVVLVILLAPSVPAQEPPGGWRCVGRERVGPRGKTISLEQEPVFDDKGGQAHLRLICPECGADSLFDVSWKITGLLAFVRFGETVEIAYEVSRTAAKCEHNRSIGVSARADVGHPAEIKVVGKFLPGKQFDEGMREKSCGKGHDAHRNAEVPGKQRAGQNHFVARDVGAAASFRISISGPGTEISFVYVFARAAKSDEGGGNKEPKFSKFGDARLRDEGTNFVEEWQSWIGRHKKHLVKGDRVRVDVTSATLDLTLLVIGLKDKRWTVEGSPNGRDPQFEVTIPATADYIFVVWSAEPRKKGAYHISFKYLEFTHSGRLDKGDETYDGRLCDTGTIYGKKGEVIEITLSSTDFEPRLLLRLPGVRKWRSTGLDDKGRARIKVTLPEDGKYIWYLMPSDEWSAGSWRVHFRRK